MTAHYFTRRASQERRLAREALTDAARQRHANLAEYFAAQARQAHDSHQSRLALGALQGRAL